MSDFSTKINMNVEVTMTLTEQEARALDAITGYNVEDFIIIFYKHMGKAYLEKYEAGLRSLFHSVRRDLYPKFKSIDEAKKLLDSE